MTLDPIYFESQRGIPLQTLNVDEIQMKSTIFFLIYLFDDIHKG